MTDFGGKQAVVTGAASGIGRATAKALADAGATVTLLDVNDEMGASAAEAAGGTYAHLDVSNPDEWRELFGVVRPPRPAAPQRRHLRHRAGRHHRDLRRPLPRRTPA